MRSKYLLLVCNTWIAWSWITCNLHDWMICCACFYFPLWWLLFPLFIFYLSLTLHLRHFHLVYCTLTVYPSIHPSEPPPLRQPTFASTFDLWPLISSCTIKPVIAGHSPGNQIKADHTFWRSHSPTRPSDKPKNASQYNSMGYLAIPGWLEENCRETNS